MEWQQIIGFHMLVKHGSFTRAAEATYRTQSALSQQVMKLEGELQCKLIDRISRRKFVLTPAGKRLYEFAQSMAEQFDALAEDISEIKGLPKGSLRMAAPFTTLYHLLPGPIKGFLRKFPHVELTVLDRPQGKVIEMLRNGEVDVGAALESRMPKGLLLRRWKEVETVLLVPPRHPLLKAKGIGLSHIADYPLIMPPREGGSEARRFLEEQFARQGIRYKVVMESSNVELSARYVEMGMGVSFATVVRGEDVLKGRRLKQISLRGLFGADHISLATRKQDRPPSYLTGFIAHVLKG